MSETVLQQKFYLNANETKILHANLVQCHLPLMDECIHYKFCDSYLEFRTLISYAE